MIAAKSTLTTVSSYVEENDNEFLALWPHRYDYLWSPHPKPGTAPNWKTESRHPLSDRLITQGSYLYGVRFGPMTKYCMLDIDGGSLYHPRRDPLGIERIRATLEPLGLVESICCTSSYSGGLHLYFPFEHEIKSWAIALTVTTLLENAGFTIMPGHLEVFPHAKPYVTNGETSLYNGHRLPLQQGSYVLSKDMFPIYAEKSRFVEHWKSVQQKNDVNQKILSETLNRARRIKYPMSTKASKFLGDLNAEIEQGWTGPGQTNHILGRITMRSYIFGHVLNSPKPLEGDDLAQDIVETAKALPGYEEWCQHQHEIESKAIKWARSIENSHYYHYGAGKSKKLKEEEPTEQKDNGPTWNETQQNDARERIGDAVRDMLEKDTLPVQITARFKAISKYGISGKTLYKHMDLWHPDHMFSTEEEEQSVPPSNAPHLHKGGDGSVGFEATDPRTYPSLLVEKECNTLADKDLSTHANSDFDNPGCNESETAEKLPAEGIQLVLEALARIKQKQRKEKLNKE
ncbi:MAG: hypothetical protein AAGD25_10195 [Cyanobacteria bacterium P01_F01_bin.150]